MKLPQTPPFQSILFVCLGNICRSPLAEGLARHLATNFNLPLRIDSAGTSSWHSDEAPHSHSCVLAKQHGFDIDHLRARQVSIYRDEAFDLIIALDQNNYYDLLNLGFSREKVYKLGDFGLEGADIPDPYGLSDNGFARVYEMIELCIRNLLSLYHPEICATIPTQN